jgi:hypothetical protein
MAELKPKKDFCLKIRGRKKLYLFNGSRDIGSYKFFNDLFAKNLKTLKHHLIRFHLLYQIIEDILVERFNNVFDDLIGKYISHDILKNDFIEEINELGKERPNIRKVIECLQKEEFDCDIVNLERDCKDLLESHNKKIRQTVGDLIYDVRNLIVHNYREIEENEIETIESITHEIELITINLIEKYRPQKCL